MSDIPNPPPKQWQPRWVVVMDSGMQSCDGVSEACLYSMGIAIDDGCLVVLRELDGVWKPAGGWIPLEVAKRLGELVHQCDRCQDHFLADMSGIPLSDVFYKIQREMGRIVCPDCIAHEKPWRTP